MGRGASQSYRAGAGEIHPPPNEYYFPNNKRGSILIPRVLRPFSPRTGDQSRNIRPGVDGEPCDAHTRIACRRSPVISARKFRCSFRDSSQASRERPPFALSSLALALIFAISHRFHLNTAIVVLLCLLVTVMHALADGLISSAIISLHSRNMPGLLLCSSAIQFSDRRPTRGWVFRGFPDRRKWHGVARIEGA